MVTEYIYIYIYIYIYVVASIEDITGEIIVVLKRVLGRNRRGVNGERKTM